jgi:asparagine synthase (glutamine-hydrolysing)
VLPAPLRRHLGAAIGAVPPDRWDRIVPAIPMAGVKAHKIARMLRTPLGPADIYRESSEEWREGPPMRDPPAITVAPDDRRLAGRGAEERMMRWDMLGYLPDDILTKIDRASMAASLEVRTPFLDHRVIAEAWRLPLAFKKRGGQGKWVLRRILDRHVPSSLIERPKAGFAVPIGSWLRGPLRDWAESLLAEQALAADPLLDPVPIRRRWAEHLGGSRDWTGSLWGVLVYRMWAASC